MRNDPIYLLATCEEQAFALYATYRQVDDEDAIQIVRSGMISGDEETAREHQARAGAGKVFALVCEIAEIPT